jgi:hypothetical protein
LLFAVHDCSVASPQDLLHINEPNVSGAIPPPGCRVEVTTVRYDGITHDFMMLNPLSNTHATRAAVAEAISILRDALRGG